MMFLIMHQMAEMPWINLKSSKKFKLSFFLSVGDAHRMNKGRAWASFTINERNQENLAWTRVLSSIWWFGPAQ